MTLKCGSLHRGHCSPVAGASLISSAVMRFFNSSTSSGNAETRFQIGMRSSVSMMSPIIPMVSPLKNGLLRNNHSTSLGLAASHDPEPHPWRPDPADTRVPIGPPDTISMHCDMAALNQDSIEPGKDQLLAGHIDLFAGAGNGLIKQVFVISHASILQAICGHFHSYFPLALKLKNFRLFPFCNSFCNSIKFSY